MNTQTGPDLSWILNELVDVPHARDAVLLAGDGMLKARSKDVKRELAETVSALSSGMQSLSRGAADFSSGNAQDEWEQTMVQFGSSFLFLVAAGDGSYLAVSAGREVNVKALSVRIHHTIGRMREALAEAPRHAAADGS